MALHAAEGGEIVFPIIDDPQRPFAGAEAGAAGESTGFSDGAGFADGTTFQSGLAGFELAEPAQEGDTMCRLKRTAGLPLRGGEYWSFDHPDAGRRLYAVKALDEENSGGVFEVQFLVPLRQDLPAGAGADFTNPGVTMRIVSDPKDLWPVIQPPFRSDVSVRMSESFDYLDD